LAMKTKAYPPILATCALLGAPASAAASTLEVFTVSGGSSFGGMTTTTLSGTFDYNAGAFSNFAITATVIAPSSSDFFNENNLSSNTEISALSSVDSNAFLTLFPSTSLDLSGRINHVQRDLWMFQQRVPGGRLWFAHGVGCYPAPSVVTFVCWRPRCNGTPSSAKKALSLIVKIDSRDRCKLVGVSVHSRPSCARARKDTSPAGLIC
jgi:hypothetical protein